MARWEKRDVETEDWRDVDNSYHIMRGHFQRPNVPLPEGWVKCQGEEGPYYQHPNHKHVRPHPRFSYPIPPFQRHRDVDRKAYHPYIRFTGKTMYVTFQHMGPPEERARLVELVERQGAAPEMEVIMGDGIWGGRIRLNLEKRQRLPDRELCRILAISKARTDLKKAHWGRLLFSETEEREELKGVDIYECVNVLWIGMREDGMAYRRGIGRVWKEAWERLGGRIEELSCLLT
jgi:hypothetical protein